jgi:hypothetical protein
MRRRSVGSLQSPIFVLMIVRKGRDCYYIKLGVRRMCAGNTGKQLTFQSRAAVYRGKTGKTTLKVAP